MDGTWFVVLEAHGHCATLYLQGELETREAERAVTLCAALPPAVRTLRIEARGVSPENRALMATVRALEMLWTTTREPADRPGPGGARAPVVVTISLHDRADAVTGSGQRPGDSITPPSPVRGPICASSR
ncbi:MAG TPA: hypothetical protein VEA99_20210 [Gemmatimonadaceae bacterium]|nr:hypothetical protein [Gemmatimonadaceae bacterium]